MNRNKESLIGIKWALFFNMTVIGAYHHLMVVGLSGTLSYLLFIVFVAAMPISVWVLRTKGIFKQALQILVAHLILALIIPVFLIPWTIILLTFLSIECIIILSIEYTLIKEKRLLKESKEAEEKVKKVLGEYSSDIIDT